MWSSTCIESNMQATRGAVVTFRPPGARIATHERARNESLARQIAAIKGYDFAGEYHDGLRDGRPFYFVLHDTLVGASLARELGIRSTGDFYGGLVPHP